MDILINALAAAVKRLELSQDFLDSKTLDQVQNYRHFLIQENPALLSKLGWGIVCHS
jgi:hypothetical protein